MLKRNTPSRFALLCSVVLALAACSGDPMQTASVDDQSADSPYAGTPEEFDALESPDAAGPDEADPVATGSVSRMSSLSAIAGTWATDDAACSTGTTAVTIGSDQIQAFGKSCDIASVIGSGANNIAATLSCPASASDVATSEIVRFERQEDGTLQVNLVGTEDPPQVLSRCP